MQLQCAVTVYCGTVTKNGKAMEKNASEQVTMAAQTRIKF